MKIRCINVKCMYNPYLPQNFWPLTSMVVARCPMIVLLLVFNIPLSTYSKTKKGLVLLLCSEESNMPIFIDDMGMDFELHINHEVKFLTREFSKQHIIVNNCSG